MKPSKIYIDYSHFCCKYNSSGEVKEILCLCTSDCLTKTASRGGLWKSFISVFSETYAKQGKCVDWRRQKLPSFN